MINNEKIIDLLESIHIANTLGNEKLATLNSQQLYNFGISLSEQIEILQLLADEYKYIKYSVEPMFKSVDDIPDELLLELYGIEDMELSGKSDFADMVEGLLAEKIYRIAVLTRFSTKIIPVEKPTKKKAKDKADSPEPFIVKDLDVENYNKKKGILTFNSYKKIDFSNAGNIRRSNGKMYKRPELLGLLFNNVKSLKQGVSFSKILGVNDPIIVEKQKKNIRNTVLEINGLVKDIGGPDNLIIIQGSKVFLHKSYLL